MKSHWKHRLLPGLLAAHLVVHQGMMPLAAYAETAPAKTATACPHHTHDEDCGYIEGTPCGHEHSWDCYVLVEKCVHVHTVDCFPEEEENGDAANRDATPSQGERQERREPTECIHVCSEEEGCIAEKLNCQHEHDSQCGYAEGTPCTFDPSDCRICNPAENAGGSKDDFPEDSGNEDSEITNDEDKNDGEEECSCVVSCEEDNRNMKCPICGKEDGDLSLCQGKPAAASPSDAAAVSEQVPEEISGRNTIDGVEYTDMGDYTEKSLSLSSSPEENQIYYAGNGYVLWNGTDKTVTLHDASITAYYALEVPADAHIVVEGSNTLTGTGSQALMSLSGSIAITGPGSLTAISQAENFGWTYAISAGLSGAGDVSIDIGGDLITGDDSSGGIQAQSGSVTIKTGGEISINGLVRAGGATSLEAGTGLTITNEKNMAVQSVSGGNVSLSTASGNITVSGGNAYHPYAIQGGSGTVTLDAGGEIRVADYNGYPGINGGSLELSGIIPENTTLHSSCNVTIPEGKTLVNNGTLFPNAGTVTVAGTLENGSTASIKNGNGTITPTITGGGTVKDPSNTPKPGPITVSTLDLRFDAPAAETEYTIISGGTAKWEPGSNGVANKLTLDSVTMTGSSYVLAVPANTEIILTGTNRITATGYNAVFAKNGSLKITGTGSLDVTSPYSPGYTLYGDNGIDINISGALSVAGQIRAHSGTVAISSGDEIAVDGSVYGSGSIAMEAGKSLSVANSAGAGFFATGCQWVSLTAKDGDLTVTGTNNHAIFGTSTEIDLSASGDLNITAANTLYAIDGSQLKLSGTIPENTTLYANCDVTVPADRTLTNNGTLRMHKTDATLTVDGTLNNNGTIINGIGAVTPMGSGTVNQKGDLDFTKGTTAASGAGYSWDSQTKTLTLNGYDNTTSPASGLLIVLPDGAKLILEGDNKAVSQTSSVIKAMGTLEISGSGSITGTAGGNVALDAEGAATILGDCTVSLTTTSSEQIDISVIETNGNALTIDGNAKVTCTVENPSGRGWGIRTRTGNLTIGTDAAVTVRGALVGILTGSSSTLVPNVEVNIHGTLDTTGCSGESSLCANLLGVNLDMEGSRILMDETSHLWLHQTSEALRGETDVAEFSGLLKVGTGNGPMVNYYKVTFGERIGLYGEGSTVMFSADEPEEGKAFGSWETDEVELSDTLAETISFTMPAKDVVLKVNYDTLVSSVSLDVSELTLTVGGTKTLSAAIEPDNATNQTVVWSSEPTDIATVDEHGLVTAQKAGTAIITVTTTDGQKTASCTVTVIPAPTPVTPGNTVRYIVEHYTEDSSSDTGYALADTEYPAGTIGETVTAAPKTYAGYTYNPEISDASKALTAISSEKDIVTLKLYYDVTRYPVTVIDSYGDPSGAGSYAPKDTVTVCAGTRTGYQFSGWISGDGITFVDPESATTTFIMPEKDVSVTAAWYSDTTPSTPVTPGNTVRYIVEHYKADPFGETEYILADTEYSAGMIGESASAVPKTYDGYTYNMEISTDSAVLTAISSAEDIVTLKLYYDITLYSVTVNDSYADISGLGTYAPGHTVTIHAGTRTGYKFSGWTSGDSITFADPDSATTTFTMPDNDVSVTATWYSDTTPSTPVTPGNTVRYIVEHYKADPSGNAGYILADTEYSAGIIGQSVSAAPKTYDGYTYNMDISSDKAVLTAINSAEDIVTLKLYYDITFYPVVINGSYADANGSGTYAPGHRVTIHAGTRSGYQFSGWTSGDDIFFADPGSASTTFTMPDKAVAITANWKSTGSSNSGGSANGGGASDSGNRPWSGGSSSSGSSRNTGTSGPGTVSGSPAMDVNESDWFYNDVKFVNDMGLMPGTSSTTFSPHENAARTQPAVIFYRLDGSPNVESMNNFTDMKREPGTIWYYDAVTWVQQNNIMAGYKDDIFEPDGTITREQLAALFYNYAKYKGYDLTAVGSLDSFADKDSVSAWVLDAVTWAVGKDIINIRSGNLLAPQGTATRAEIAAMLRRFIEKNDLAPVAPDADGRHATPVWTKQTATP